VKKIKKIGPFLLKYSIFLLLYLFGGKGLSRLPLSPEERVVHPLMNSLYLFR